jgi:Fe-S cluster biogenesis protein NfuA
MPAPVVASDASAPFASVDDRIRAVLEQIRPAVQADGGDVEFVSVDESTRTAQVRFRGTCVGCPSLPLTLKGGVERAIRSQVPEIDKVISIG